MTIELELVKSSSKKKEIGKLKLATIHHYIAVVEFQINMKNDDSKHYYDLFGVLPLPIGVEGI
jgi:hypothetical protein